MATPKAEKPGYVMGYTSNTARVSYWIDIPGSFTTPGQKKILEDSFKQTKEWAEECQTSKPASSGAPRKAHRRH